MKTNIMGTAVATVQQMQSYIQKVNPAVPKSVIDMVEYYISEGKTEGVRGDIAFAQSCLETGNFTFNGSAVTLDQNNFAGIGVTKNGMKGNSFSHPWIGIRAQIQHLKAYASNEKLYGVCVDPRFCYVKRGIAPYVEWLGIQENPQGGGWAAGKNYGSKILEILAKIITMPEANKEDVTMNLNTSLISNNNSYANQVPKYIVIHNTDNFAKGANAKAHANVSNLIATHTGTCVRACFISILEIGVDVHAVGSFALNFHVSLIECGFDRTIIHNVFNVADTFC